MNNDEDQLRFWEEELKEVGGRSYHSDRPETQCIYCESHMYPNTVYHCCGDEFEPKKDIFIHLNEFGENCTVMVEEFEGSKGKEQYIWELKGKQTWPKKKIKKLKKPKN